MTEDTNYASPEGATGSGEVEVRLYYDSRQRLMTVC